MHARGRLHAHSIPPQPLLWRCRYLLSRQAIHSPEDEEWEVWAATMLDRDQVAAHPADGGSPRPPAGRSVRPPSLPPSAHGAMGSPGPPRQLALLAAGRGVPGCASAWLPPASARSQLWPGSPSAARSTCRTGREDGLALAPRGKGGKEFLPSWEALSSSSGFRELLCTHTWARLAGPCPCFTRDVLDWAGARG